MTNKAPGVLAAVIVGRVAGILPAIRGRATLDTSLGVFMAVVATIILAGCRQQQDPSNERMARLLAAQNAEMRQEAMARLAENQALQHKHVLELQRRDEELAKCRARIAELQKDLEEGIAERVRSVTTAVVDENARLRREIEELRVQVEKLKGQAEAEAPPLETP